MSSNLLNFEKFILSAMTTVLSGPRFLSGGPMFEKSLLSELSMLFSLLFLSENLSLAFFFCHNHLFHRVSEFFVVP
jgi:hypothetical protein